MVAEQPFLRTRLAAWLIDLLMVLGVGVWFDGLGWVASGAYWLCRDSLFGGQSIGKRIMGLRVVSDTDRRCDLKASVIRNVLWVVPGLNLLMGLASLLIVTNDPRARHWGDRLADTRVVRVT